MINIIAAVAKNRAIGYQNKLIYWLPNDLKRFKALTTGHTIIMGRNTFLSLPKGALPNRRNIVLSRSVKSFEGCDVYPSLEEALAHCAKDEEVYIIGGASVYQQALTFIEASMPEEIIKKELLVFPVRNYQLPEVVNNEDGDANYCLLDSFLKMGE